MMTAHCSATAFRPTAARRCVAVQSSASGRASAPVQPTKKASIASGLCAGLAALVLSASPAMAAEIAPSQVVGDMAEGRDKGRELALIYIGGAALLTGAASSLANGASRRKSAPGAAGAAAEAAPAEGSENAAEAREWIETWRNKEEKAEA